MNSYIPDSHVRPFEHSCLGRQKRDLLAFGLEIIEGLVGGFYSRQLLGRPRSSAHVLFDWLNVSIGHYPDFTERKAGCVVCSTAGDRHETFVQCLHCQVSLFVARGRRCFTLYHTPVDYAN